MRIIAACAFVLALLGTLAPEVAAQTSCSGWNATCLSRCGNGCQNCRAKLAECKKTGCWTEVAKFGGGQHCKLKKS